MANIKFYRAGNGYWDNNTPLEGYIWFNTDDRTISLYKEGDWETYAGIVSASYNENVLTITPAVGNPIVVDLTDLGKIRTELNEEKGKINTIQTALATVIGQLKNIEEKEGAVKEYVDNKVDGKFDTVGSAEQALTDAKQYTDDEIDKLSFDEAGTAKTLADQALADAKDYTDSVVGVLPKADDKTLTVAEAIKAAADAAAAAQADIDAWNSATEDTNGVIETIKELNTYITKHTDAFIGLSTRVGTAEADITTIKGDIETINATIEENELVVAEALNDLNTRVDNLASGTVASVTGTNYITATTTDGAVTVSATTGTVANDDNALALASDVKQYVDDCWTWGEF